MKILVVYCHPCPESFVASVLQSALKGLATAGHETRVLDLHAIGFDPVMRAQERRDYHTPGLNEEPVHEHLAHLRWCEAVIFVYPTWWYGPPAMLKGWLDRVWVPHATFTMPADGKPIGPVLTQIRLIAAITTLGSPWWWWTFAMRSPGRRIMLTGLRALCGVRCKTLWIAQHRMDEISEAQRRQFLARVESRMAALKG